MEQHMKHLTLTSTFVASLLIATSAPAVFAVEEEDIQPAAEIIVEEAAAIIGLDLEGIEEDLLTEIEESIREEIIEEETVEAILDETVEDVNDFLKEREEENREQWEGEKESWLEADKLVREQLNCEPGDSDCFRQIGLNVRLLVAEKLYTRVQERLENIESIPEEERTEELNELYESLQKLEQRFAGKIERVEERIETRASNVEQIKENINALREKATNRFMEEGIQPVTPNPNAERGANGRPSREAPREESMDSEDAESNTENDSVVEAEGVELETDIERPKNNRGSGNDNRGSGNDNRGTNDKNTGRGSNQNDD
jgi:hypothetical protein